MHSEKLYKCVHCPHTFKEKSACRKHMYFAHNGDKEFKCDQCSASFERKCNLTNHKQRVVHPEQVLHNCTICFLVFTEETKLKEHYRICHPKEDPEDLLSLSKVRDNIAIIKKEMPCISPEFGTDMEDGIEVFHPQSEYSKPTVRHFAIRTSNSLRPVRSTHRKGDIEISNAELQKMIVLRIRMRYRSLFE